MRTIFITADWCGHCKRFYPELKKLKRQLRGGNIPYKHYRDGKDTEKIQKIEQFQGYPTIIIGGELYDGPRDAESLFTAITSSPQQNGGGQQNMDVLMNYFRNNYYGH